jgi:hypothetical protein
MSNIHRPNLEEELSLLSPEAKQELEQLKALSPHMTLAEVALEHANAPGGKLDKKGLGEQTAQELAGILWSERMKRERGA